MVNMLRTYSDSGSNSGSDSGFYLKLLMAILLFSLTACAANKPLAVVNNEMIGKVRPGMPAIDPSTAIYELPVNDGVSYQDVIDSLKSLSEGLNFVNPANFPIGEHMKLRGVDPHGMKDVRSFCNLSMGTEIILDHPEFLVFAPCRIAIYEKPDANNKLKLYIAMDRPTYDLKSIKNPTERARKSAQELETVLLEIMDRARKGDF
jgi:uncharacterized protein (DUF302 family)